MDDQVEKGSQIIKAVYKASLKALFAIGVKSPEYVDMFTMRFSQELDREFLKIGLFEAPVDKRVEDSRKPQSEPQTTTNQSVKVLGLSNFTVLALKKAGILTLDELMCIMQKESLTSIKGIKDKSAKEILKRFAEYNEITNINQKRNG